MVIKQVLTKEDSLILNMHIFSKNKKIYINVGVIAAFSLIGAILTFIKKSYVLGAVFTVLGLISLFGIIPFFKSKIKKDVYKKMENKEWNISVSIDGDQFYYAFDHEDLSKVDPFIFGDIIYAYEYKNHFIFKMNIGTYLIISKKYIDDLDSFRKILEEKLILNSRYFVNLKKDY